MSTTLDKKVINHLVLTLGFSQYNAMKAIEMFRTGELNRQEEDMMQRIYLNPDFDRDKITYYKDSSPKVWVADHLNYRITQEGGEPVTRSRDAC